MIKERYVEKLQELARSGCRFLQVMVCTIRSNYNGALHDYLSTWWNYLSFWYTDLPRSYPPAANSGLNRRSCSRTCRLEILPRYLRVQSW